MEIEFNDYRTLTVQQMRRIIQSCSPVWRADNASAATSYAYRAKQEGLDEAYKFWSSVAGVAYETISYSDPREKDPVKTGVE